MIKLAAYKTSDNEIHTSYSDAYRHAENRYGEQLTSMAHQLVSIDKYSAMVDKLDGFKGSMSLLLKLADDLILDNEESDE